MLLKQLPETLLTTRFSLANVDAQEELKDEPKAERSKLAQSCHPR